MKRTEERIIRMKPMARTKERPMRVLRPAIGMSLVWLFEVVGGFGACYARTAWSSTCSYMCWGEAGRSAEGVAGGATVKMVDATM